MPGPSLQLGVNAAGQDTLIGLNEQLAKLRANLTGLKTAKADLSGLQSANEALKLFTSEFARHGQAIRTAFAEVSAAAKAGFAELASVLKTGGIEAAAAAADAYKKLDAEMLRGREGRQKATRAEIATIRSAGQQVIEAEQQVAAARATAAVAARSQPVAAAAIFAPAETRSAQIAQMEAESARFIEARASIAAREEAAQLSLGARLLANSARFVEALSKAAGMEGTARTAWLSLIEAGTAQVVGVQAAAMRAEDEVRATWIGKILTGARAMADARRRAATIEQGAIGGASAAQAATAMPPITAATPAVVQTPALVEGLTQIRQQLSDGTLALRTAFAELAEAIRAGMTKVAVEAEATGKKARSTVAAERQLLQAEYEKMLADGRRFNASELGVIRQAGVRLTVADQGVIASRPAVARQLEQAQGEVRNPPPAPISTAKDSEIAAAYAQHQKQVAREMAQAKASAFEQAELESRSRIEAAQVGGFRAWAAKEKELAAARVAESRELAKLTQAGIAAAYANAAIPNSTRPASPLQPADRTGTAPVFAARADANFKAEADRVAAEKAAAWTQAESRVQAEIEKTQLTSFQLWSAKEKQLAAQRVAEARELAKLTQAGIAAAYANAAIPNSTRPASPLQPADRTGTAPVFAARANANVKAEADRIAAEKAAAWIQADSKAQADIEKAAQQSAQGFLRMERLRRAEMLRAAKESDAALAAGMRENTAYIRSIEEQAARIARAEAAFQARPPAAQARTVVRTRAALDSGLDTERAAASFGPTAVAAAQAATGIDSLRAAHARLGAESESTGAKTQRLNAIMRDLHSATRGVASGFNAMFLTWGNIAPLLAGAALSHAFVQTVKLGAEVEHTLAIIKNLGGNTTQEVEDVKASLLDLGATGPFGPKEIASAFQTLSLAGLSAKEQVAAIKDVLNFAVAGTLGIEKAAETLVTIGTAFGYTADNYGRIGDAIAKTAAISVSSVESVADSLKVATAVANQYGVTLEDALTQVALLSNVGVRATAAGTAVRNFYSELSGGNQKAAKALEKILGVDEFGKANTLIDQTTGKFKSLTEIVTLLNNGLSKIKIEDRMKAISAISTERGGKDMNAVLQAANQMVPSGKLDAEGQIIQISRLQKAIDDVTNSYGAASIMAAEMALTTTNQMKSVVSALQTSMVAAFDEIQPSIIVLSQTLKAAFNSEEFKSTLAGLASSVANATVFLVEHGREVGIVAAAYLAYKGAALGLSVIGALGSMFATLTAGVMATTAAVTGSTAAATSSALVWPVLSAEMAATGVTGAAAGVGMGIAGTAAAGAGIAARAASVGFAILRAAMGPLAILIGAGVTLWMMYKAATASAGVTASDTAGIINDELIKSLEKEAERLETRNRLMREGRSEMQATEEEKRLANRAQIVEANTKRETEALASVQAARAKAAAAPAGNGIDFGAMSPEGGFNNGTAGSQAVAASGELIAAEQALQQARARNLTDLNRIDAEQARIQRAQKERELNRQAEVKAAADAAGRGTIPFNTAKPDLKAQHAAEKAEADRLRGLVEEAHQVQARAKEEEFRNVEDIQRLQKRGMIDELETIEKTSNVRARSLQTQIEEQMRIVSLEEARSRIKNADPAEARAVEKAKGDLEKLQDAAARNQEKLEQQRSDYYERTIDGINTTTTSITRENTTLDEEYRNFGRSREAILSEEAARYEHAAAVIAQNVEIAKQNGLSEDNIRVMQAAQAQYEALGRRARTQIRNDDVPQYEKNLVAWQDTVGQMKLAYDAMVDGIQQKGQDVWSRFIKTGKLSASELLDVIRDTLAKQTYQEFVAPGLTAVAKGAAGFIFGERGKGNGLMTGGGTPAGATDPVAEAAKLTSDSLRQLQDSATPLTRVFDGLGDVAVDLGRALLSFAKSSTGGEDGWISTVVGAIGSYFGGGMSIDTSGAGSAGFSGGSAGGSVSGSGAGARGYSMGDAFESVKRFSMGDTFVRPTYAFAKGGHFTNQVVSQKTPFSFAQGTALGEMGEAGPEAVMPLKRGPDGSLGVSMHGGNGGNGGDTKVSVVVENHSGSKAQVKESRNPDGSRMIRVIIDQVKSEMVNDVHNGGPFAAAIETQYGSNRANGLARR